jgi:single-stranded-DNA-specific exonuclease
MNPRNRLDDDLKSISDSIRDLLRKEGKFLVISGPSPDGIAASSIIFHTLERLSAKCVLRSTINLTDCLRVGNSIAHEYDLCLLLDFEHESAERLDKNLQDKWLLIRHLSNEIAHESNEKYGRRVLNINWYGFNGWSEVTTAGICYLISITLDPKNADLSVLAVLSSLGERQDGGEGRSLVGINAEIVRACESQGLLRSQPDDLMMVGREWRPIHEAIALTRFPYIDGLTWNSQKARSIVENSGIKLRDNGKWRVIAELPDQEKWSIYEGITKFVATNSGTDLLPLEGMRGMSYTLLKEDKGTPLRDAREYSDMLRICGKVQESGVAISVCLGDRFKMLAKAEETVIRYLDIQRRSLRTIFGEKWRIWLDRDMVFINGEGAVTEDALEDITVLLQTSPQFLHKILISRTVTQAGTYKYCCRTNDLTKYTEMASAMRKCSNASPVLPYPFEPYVLCCEVSPNNIEGFVSCLKAEPRTTEHEISNRR